MESPKYPREAEVVAGKSQTRQPALLLAADENLDDVIKAISSMTVNELRNLWRQSMGGDVPNTLTRDLLVRWLIYDLQEQALGSLSPRYLRLLDKMDRPGDEPARHVKTGSVIVREYQGTVHEVLVVPDGFCWQGQVYSSLSTIARRITGTSWNGPRFFGLRGAQVQVQVQELDQDARSSVEVASAAAGSTAVKSHGRISRAPTSRRTQARR
jgi:hypothetical protein